MIQKQKSLKLSFKNFRPQTVVFLIIILAAQLIPLSLQSVSASTGDNAPWGLQYPGKVLGVKTYDKVLITSPSYTAVQIWVTPLSYLAEDNTWVYELSGRSQANRLGSIAINSDYQNLLVPEADSLGSTVLTGIAPNSKTRVEFFSKPNVTNGSSTYLLVRKYFTALAPDPDVVETPSPETVAPSPAASITMPQPAFSGSFSQPRASVNNTPINTSVVTQVGPYYWGGKISSVGYDQMIPQAKKLSEDLGSRVIRVALSPAADKTYKSGADCMANFSLAGLASRSDFSSIIQDPQFSTVIITAYDGVTWPDCLTKNYLDPNFFTSANISRIKQEYTGLANYLKQFNKTFIIDTWEADNDIYCNAAYGATPAGCPNADSKVNAYTQWMKARIDGLTPPGAATVKTAMEINSVHWLPDHGMPSALENILPQVNVDYVSYSSYESINVSAAQTANDIDLIRSKLSAMGKDPNTLFLGEVGFDTLAFGQSASAGNLQGILSVARQKNIPYLIVWNLIDSPSFGIYNTSGKIT